METKILKKVDLETMEKVFEDTKPVYIKWYNQKKENYFEICIRHGEDEDPKALLDAAIKNKQEIKPKPKCEICNDKKYINITDTIKSPCKICNI
jgi:hypothetical protein